MFAFQLQSDEKTSTSIALSYGSSFPTHFLLLPSQLSLICSSSLKNHHPKITFFPSRFVRSIAHRAPMFCRWNLQWTISLRKKKYWRSKKQLKLRCIIHEKSIRPLNQLMFSVIDLCFYPHICYSFIHILCNFETYLLNGIMLQLYHVWWSYDGIYHMNSSDCESVSLIHVIIVCYFC